MNSPFNQEAAPLHAHGPLTASISGERRQVTALFYDIVNSTRLLNAMDPEEFGRLQRQIHAEAAAAIGGRAGHLGLLLGDGGCAYFGYPEPDEDAAENAVAASLDLVERCRALGRTWASDSPFKVRVGVATGLVVISNMAKAGLPGQDEIIGIAPTLAARLQSEAEPNGVAVADTTYRLTRLGFDFELIGARELKGFAEPVRVWRPVARRVLGDRFSSSRRPDAPLSGRSEELDLCRRRWARARGGQGQVVLLVGEPGIGKSRLVSELRREAAAFGCDARVFQCQPRGNTRPLHPFVDSLRRDVLGSSGSDALPDRNAVVGYLADEGIAGGAADVIAFLLGDETEPAEASSELADLSSEQLRRRAVDAATELVAAWARKRPQFIVVEDVHWADTLTEALLSGLIEVVERLPVILIVTSRQKLPSDITNDPHVLTLALTRLDAAAMSRLLEAIWHPVPRNLASFIYRKSDGIPLFAEELAHLLKERIDTRESTERDWERSLRESGVTTLQDLITARLGNLGEARRAAQVASAIGRDFSYDLLSRVTGMNTASTSLDDALARLVDAGVIRRRNTAEGLAFRFRHVLMYEAAYESLLKSERRQLHEQIVALVAAGAVPAPPDEIMAWHCEQAGQPLEAGRYAIRAAEICVVRSAVQEADRLLSSAEEQLDQCAATDERDELVLRLLATRGAVAMALFGKGSPQARTAYEQGVQFCQRESVRDREQWFPLYWGWWFTAPDSVTMRRRSEAILSDFDGANDPEVRLQAFHCAWAANFHAGRHAHCLRCIENGLALYDPKRAVVSRVSYGGHDAKVCGLAERGQSLWILGDVEAAHLSMEAALRWAETTEHVGSLCHALDAALLLSRYENDHESAVKLADRLGEVAKRHALPEARAKSRIFRGWATAFKDDLMEGLQELREGLKLQRAVGTDEDLPVYVGMAAELLGHLERTAVAAALLDDAIAHAQRTTNTFWLPELYRVRASLRQSVDPGLAMADLRSGRELAQNQGAEAFIRRIDADLAALIGMPGDKA